MSKMIAIAAVLCWLAACSTVRADLLLSCQGVPRVSLVDMQSDGNDCRFLTRATDDKRTSFGSYDKLETCACNLLNKELTWASMMKPEVAELNSIMVKRLDLDEVDAYPSPSSNWKLSKETILSEITKEDYDYMGRARTEMPADKFKSLCQAHVDEFEKFNALFENLNSFVGHVGLSARIVSAQPTLGKLFTVYLICRQAGF